MRKRDRGGGREIWKRRCEQREKARERRFENARVAEWLSDVGCPIKSKSLICTTSNHVLISSNVKELRIPCGHE